MTFSFGFRAANVAGALALAAQEMDKVVAQQPVHANDREKVLTNVATTVGLVEAGAAGKHLMVAVSGSVGWRGIAPGTANLASEDFAITAASCNVNAYCIPADAEDKDYGPLRHPSA